LANFPEKKIHFQLQKLQIVLNLMNDTFNERGIFTAWFWVFMSLHQIRSRSAKKLATSRERHTFSADKFRNGKNKMDGLF
jgi:hypothetical protein